MYSGSKKGCIYTRKLTLGTWTILQLYHVYIYIEDIRIIFCEQSGIMV